MRAFKVMRSFRKVKTSVAQVMVKAIAQKNFARFAALRDAIVRGTDQDLAHKQWSLLHRSGEA